MKYKLGAKFGSLAQRWDKVGLEKKRARANHGGGSRIDSAGGGVLHDG
jgi:hypothetical protein